MKKYEYFTDYFALPLSSKKEVDVLGLLKNPKYQEMLKSMGQNGWELVSTVPIIEATTSSSFWNSDTYSNSITTGFLLYWKREVGG